MVAVSVLCSQHCVTYDVWRLFISQTACVSKLLVSVFSVTILSVVAMHHVE